MKINYLCSFIFTWGLKYFLTVENQLIISIIQHLGRPPTRKQPNPPPDLFLLARPAARLHSDRRWDYAGDEPGPFVPWNIAYERRYSTEKKYRLWKSFLLRRIAHILPA